MMEDSGYVADPDFAIHAIKQRPADLLALLRRSTVFFAVRNERGETTRVAGSGVVADLYGTKTVLTAGHVLREFQREFDDGRMCLSVNQPRGSFAVRSDSVRLVSGGGDRGPDAGVLILPSDQVETYFQYGGFEPARASTLRPALPPTGVACIVGGYPAQGTEFFNAEGPGGRYSWYEATLTVIGARLLESDPIHHWLDVGDRSPDAKPVVPGENVGMSGCGFWSFGVKKEGDPPAYDVLAYLHGVHTATFADPSRGVMMRQTPIAHHLHLLAEYSADLKEKVARLWPELGLS